MQSYESSSSSYISLAQFISQSREKLGLSQFGLAKKSNIDISVIEFIENGQDLFLDTTTRQKLAKALKLNPSDIKKFEKSFNLNITSSEDSISSLKQLILQGQQNLLCPNCSSPLTVRIAKFYDLEDNLVLHPKASCSRCPFQIK